MTAFTLRMAFYWQTEGGYLLNLSVVLSLSILAAVLAIGVLRERRLRLALEALVVKLLKLWRNSHAEHNHPADQSGDPGNDRRL